MAIFSTRIKELKIEKNYLQKDIANSIGIALRTYQYYETNQREPTLSIIIKLADFFDVSIDYLVGRSDDPKRY